MASSWCHDRRLFNYMIPSNVLCSRCLWTMTASSDLDSSLEEFKTFCIELGNGFAAYRTCVYFWDSRAVPAVGWHFVQTFYFYFSKKNSKINNLDNFSKKSGRAHATGSPLHKNFDMFDGHCSSTESNNDERIACSLHLHSPLIIMTRDNELSTL